jgi:hypothetical protein
MLPGFMTVVTNGGYGLAMAVLRNTAPKLQLPPDFGMGVAVASILGALVILGSVAVASMPSEGPRGQSRQPDGEVYIDYSPPVAPGAIGTP